MQRRVWFVGVALLALGEGCSRRRRRAPDEFVPPAVTRMDDGASGQDASERASSDAASERGERSEGVLTVPAEPRNAPADRSLRFRAMVRIESDLRQVWTGPRVASWMPLSQGRALLSSLDAVPTGWFALYRAPASAESDLAVAVAFSAEGRSLFSHVLSAIGPGPSLEITDAALDGETVFYVRSCHSYARDERSRCGYLVALDVSTGAVRWSTPALTARGFITLIAERYIVVHYAFTGEPSYLTVVRKIDGRSMQRLTLRTRDSVEAVGGEGPTRTLVAHGSGTIEQRVELSGLDGERPRLRAVGEPTGEPWRGRVLQLGSHD
ncbi:MAG: hypothetical protein U0269_04635 [Polyangiales bacterium]